MDNLFTLIGKQAIINLNNGLALRPELFTANSDEELRDYIRGRSYIYAWLNKKNNKIYIGSAIDGWRRMKDYRLEFNGNMKDKRMNKKFANSIAKHGLDSFEFYILEEVPRNKELVILREQFYLDLIQPYLNNIGLNIAKTAKFHKIANYSEDARARISMRHTGENSEVSKLTDIKVLDIKTNLANGIGLKELSIKYNVSTTVISNIKRGLTWKHIKLSEEGEKILSELNEKNKHKLSKDQVILIKRDISNGMRTRDIAEKYDMVYSTVHSIRNGHIYSYITVE